MLFFEEKFVGMVNIVSLLVIIVSLTLHVCLPTQVDISNINDNTGDYDNSRRNLQEKDIGRLHKTLDNNFL